MFDTQQSPFRSAPNITLEQTVNCDAASRRTEIDSFTNVAAARSRWMVTHSAQSSVVSNSMAKKGISPVEDTNKELKKYRMQIDQEDLTRVMKGFVSCQSESENLHCILLGKKCDHAIKRDLLNVQERDHE